MKRFLPLLLSFCCWIPLSFAGKKTLPNILWITSEDNGPHLGCYGDKYATTPNLDALAKKSLIYTRAISNAPVCAPARTTIISGLYPPSTGSEHMRSMANLPSDFQFYPTYLRELGYYCTNNSKQDYNLTASGDSWHESSRKAHWKNRPENAPFFSIFNFTVSHESQIRKRPHNAVHDPKKVRVPAYHPDHPAVRQDWAQYYDKLTEMDDMVGAKLKELEDAGLAEDTIIFYYGDHGSGMPRSKRWPYFSGLNVPLIVHIPDNFKHLRSPEYKVGGKTDRRVGFIDLAPTLLSLAGKKPPTHFQGHAFQGTYHAKPQEFGFGFRGRMDERYDMVRTVVGERYIYIRNYMPHKLYGQHVGYMFITPTTQVWKQLYDAGKLNEAQSHFWKTKPAEELYDLYKDPDEVNNLIKEGDCSCDHKEVLSKMRKALRQHTASIRDVGFLPEGEIHERSSGSTPYEMGHNDEKYPFEKIFNAAELATTLRKDNLPSIIKLLEDEDSAVRYWGAMGLLMQEKTGVKTGKTALLKSLSDKSPYVRTIAAEALGKYGDKTDVQKAVQTLGQLIDPEVNGAFPAMLAMNAVDHLDEKARPILPKIQTMPLVPNDVDGRFKGYVGRLVTTTLNELGASRTNSISKKKNKKNK